MHPPALVSICRSNVEETQALFSSVYRPLTSRIQKARSNVTVPNTLTPTIATMEQDLPFDLDLPETDKTDYNLLVKTSLESHMSFLSIVHRVTEVLQTPGTSYERVAVKEIRETKPKVTESFKRAEEACLGFDVANFLDILGNPLRLYGQCHELHDRFNTLLAQSCKDADALGNFFQLYGKALLVDVEQPGFASLVSELRRFIQGLDNRTHSLSETSTAFEELAKDIDNKFYGGDFAVNKAAARLSDDLRAAWATTTVQNDQINALLDRERLLDLYTVSLRENSAVAVHKINGLADTWRRIETDIVNLSRRIEDSINTEHSTALRFIQKSRGVFVVLVALLDIYARCSLEEDA
ncbi:hypothetical protein C8Q70DRAFT_987457 [Cubamyces menziesii]|nr:hypothetical protein C8Q70DRAFT_987457 [Cubamyces menziesii]